MQRIFDKLAKLGMKLGVSCKWPKAKMGIISTLVSVMPLHCPELAVADNTHRSQSAAKDHSWYMLKFSICDALV